MPCSSTWPGTVRSLGASYYFVAHDTTAQGIANNGVPLGRSRTAFDSCPASGSSLARLLPQRGDHPPDLGSGPTTGRSSSRTLKVVQGQGSSSSPPARRVSTPTNPRGHGLFTDALLRGLKGEAANDGEVTINSLFDYIDRQMGSDRQRPMMFGQMTGRVVLMHYA